MTLAPVPYQGGRKELPSGGVRAISLNQLCEKAEDPLEIKRNYEALKYYCLVGQRDHQIPRDKLTNRIIESHMLHLPGMEGIRTLQFIFELPVIDLPTIEEQKLQSQKMDLERSSSLRFEKSFLPMGVFDLIPSDSSDLPDLIKSRIGVPFLEISLLSIAQDYLEDNAILNSCSSAMVNLFSNFELQRIINPSSHQKQYLDKKLSWVVSSFTKIKHRKLDYLGGWKRSWNLMDITYFYRLDLEYFAKNSADMASYLLHLREDSRISSIIRGFRESME